MCGIFAIFNIKGTSSETRALAIRLLKRLRHRGPEYTGIVSYESARDCHTYLCHERLAIVDPMHGDQPQFSRDGNYSTIVNGEIYNHRVLYSQMKGFENVDSNADCQVVSDLFSYYKCDAKRIANMLDGKFVVIAYDIKKKRFWVLRDHIGIVPCYLGRGINGEFYVSNELKSFHDVTNTLEVLLPGI